MPHLYDQLLKAMKILEKELDFAYDDTLGYFTSHESNMGTGMRLSFKMELDNLSHEFVRQFGLENDIEVRGKGGENEKIKGVTYFISNSRLICDSVAGLIRHTCEEVAHLIRISR